MTNKLKYSQLAKSLGVSNAVITMAIKRNKLAIDIKEKTIDIKHPVNDQWIRDQINNGKVFDLNRIMDKKPSPIRTEIKSRSPKEPVSDQEKEQMAEISSTLLEGKTLDVQQKKANIKLTERKAKTELLKIKKAEGELIPTDAIKTVFLYAAETFRNTYQQEVRSMIDIYIERFGGSHEDYIELQRDLNEAIQETHKTMKENLIAGVNGVVSDYKEVRSRGERK